MALKYEDKYGPLELPLGLSVPSDGFYGEVPEEHYTQLISSNDIPLYSSDSIPLVAAS